MLNRFNPQEIAERKYKLATEPVIVSNPPAVVSRQHDDAFVDAKNLLKRLVGVNPTGRQSSLRGIVATPVVSQEPTTTRVPTDNIAPTASLPESSPVTPDVIIVEQKSTAQLTAQLNSVRTQYSELFCKNAEDVAANVQLRTDLDEMTAQYIQASSDCDDFREANSILNETNAKLSESFRVSENDRRVAENDRRVAENDRRVAENDRRVAEKALEESNQLVEQLKEQNTTISLQISTCSEYDSILSQLINAQETIESIEEEIERSKLENEKLGNQYRAAVFETNSLRDRNACLVAAQNSAIIARKNLEDQLNLKIASLKELQGKYSVLEQGYRASLADAERLIDMNDKLRRDVRNALANKDNRYTLEASQRELDYQRLQEKYTKLTEATRAYINLTSKSE
jgi:chromosome segregation ATPase